jgi:hypothetical protein
MVEFWIRRHELPMSCLTGMDARPAGGRTNRHAMAAWRILCSEETHPFQPIQSHNGEA